MKKCEQEAIKKTPVPVENALRNSSDELLAKAIRDLLLKEGKEH